MRSKHPSNSNNGKQWVMWRNALVNVCVDFLAVDGLGALAALFAVAHELSGHAHGLAQNSHIDLGLRVANVHHLRTRRGEGERV